jgi:hypothetical protein
MKERLQSKIKGYLPAGQTIVGYFDTEQSKYHFHRVVKRICRLCSIENPQNLKPFGLRKFKPDERLKLIEYFIYNTPGLGYVIIDGIRDLVTSINDEEQATAITSKLLKWTEEKNIHILIVLHQNKGDTNARGHIGTEIVNKAETVISITKESDNKDISIIEAEFCRDKEFSPFAFKVDSEGLPYFVEHWELTAEKYNTQKGIIPTEIPEETHKAVLRKVFSYDAAPKYSQLYKQLKLSFADFGKKIGDNKAKDFLQYYQNERFITKDEQSKVYSLAV